MKVCDTEDQERVFYQVQTRGCSFAGEQRPTPDAGGRAGLGFRRRCCGTGGPWFWPGRGGREHRRRLYRPYRRQRTSPYWHAARTALFGGRTHERTLPHVPNRQRQLASKGAFTHAAVGSALIYSQGRSAACLRGGRARKGIIPCRMPTASKTGTLPAPSR